MGCDRAIVILTKPRSFVRKREKLLPVIERRYREYPNFCQTMRERAERDNRAREELFRLEKEGKVLVLAPEDLRGVSRIERDVEKLRLLWADGYQQGMERMEEIRDWYDGYRIGETEIYNPDSIGVCTNHFLGHE